MEEMSNATSRRSGGAGKFLNMMSVQEEHETLGQGKRTRNVLTSSFGLITPWVCLLLMNTYDAREAFFSEHKLGRGSNPRRSGSS